MPKLYICIPVTIIMDHLIEENLKRFYDYLPKGVTLLAVSKTKPATDIQLAYDSGHRDFGENRIQEMVEKAEQLPKDIRWHMIGHVQNNKIKYMAPFVYMVHGMDKPKRFAELNKEAEKNDRIIDCLLQVHIAKEETKFGFDYAEATAFLEDDFNATYPFLRLRGLMAMATNTDDQSVVRNEFKGLHSFFNGIRQRGRFKDFNVLSTGMSSDYKIAIEEGSTMIRIGSAIFGKRDY